MSKKPRKKNETHLSLENTKPLTKKNRSDLPAPSLLEEHFSRHQRSYLALILTSSLLFSFLCFDVKISTSMDDSTYLEAGANYAKSFFGYYFNSQAPLYPMVLGVFIKIFGFNIYFLKSLSSLFLTGSLALLFVTFRKRIAYSILVPSLLITAINFPYLAHASLTYTECFFLLVSSASLHIVLKLTDQLGENTRFNIRILIYAASIGLCAQFITLSRSIGVVSIVAFALFIAYKRKYLFALITTLSFGLWYSFYNYLVQAVWKVDRSQFASQGKTLLQKDAYDANKGMETIPGFFTRFIENAEIYISSRFMYILGFGEEYMPVNGFTTIVCIALILWSAYLMFKEKNDALVLTTLFSLVLLGTTFIVLQSYWGQTRLIMVYLPFLLFAFFFLLYYYSLKFAMARFLVPLSILVLLGSNLAATVKSARNRFPQLMINIKEDPYAGYTEDWQNYIRMSIWCKEKLPDTALVAARKAPMSFIFTGGKSFYGIYNVPTNNADSLLKPFRQAGVDYIMLSELRSNPDQYIENQYISTMHRYAYSIAQKYPDAFRLIHQEGTIEKAQLYKINYTYIDSMIKTQ